MEMLIYAILSVNKEHEKLRSLLSGMKGILDMEIYAISFADIGVVVSEVKKSSLITDKKNAIEYAGVIEALSQHFTVLPVRFGSILESEDNLRKMLESNYTEIQSNLQKVEHKYEYGLKVFCDSEKIVAELISKSENAVNINENSASIPTQSIYRDWMNKKLKEHRIEESLLGYVDTVIALFTEDLVRLNAVNKIRKMISATLIIDAVFLLEKVHKDALVRIVSDLQNQHPNLNFVLTGPWPPYNFVEISIK